MGTVYCLLSAIGFGALAVFAKLSYAAGVSVDTLLLIRFGVAGAILLALAVARGALRNLRLRAVCTALGMGAFGYATQAGLYFTALSRMDAGMVALAFSTYPVLVMVAAVALRRERASGRRMWALGVALSGIGLVLTGTGAGVLDGLGALLALGAAVTYTGYILVGDRVTAQVPPLSLAALVCVGAAATYLATGTLHGTIDVGVAPAGWLPLAALVLISTVGAILLFFAGLARVGPSKTAILSILEPVVTVTGAALVFGEMLTPIQWWGGALVLSAVVIVQWPARASRWSGAPPVARQGERHHPADGCTVAT